MTKSIAAAIACPYVVDGQLHLISSDAEIFCIIRRTFEGSPNEGFTSSCTVLVEVLQVIYDASRQLEAGNHKILKIMDWRFSSLIRDEVRLDAWNLDAAHISRDFRTGDPSDPFTMEMYRLIYPSDYKSQEIANLVDDLSSPPRLLDLYTRMAGLDEDFVQWLQLDVSYRTQFDTAFKERLAMEIAFRDFKHEVRTLESLSIPHARILPRLVLAFDDCTPLNPHTAQFERSHNYQIPTIMMDVIPGNPLLCYDGIQPPNEANISSTGPDADIFFPLSPTDVEHVFQDVQLLLVKCWTLNYQFEDCHGWNIMLWRDLSTRRIQVSLIDAGAFRFVGLPPFDYHWLKCVPDFYPDLEDTTFSTLAQVFRKFPIAASLQRELPTGCFELPLNVSYFIMWRAITTGLRNSTST